MKLTRYFHYFALLFACSLPLFSSLWQAGAANLSDVQNISNKIGSAAKTISPTQNCDNPAVEMRRQALLQAMKEAYGPLVRDGTVLVGTMDSSPEEPVFMAGFDPKKKNPESRRFDLSSITKPIATATAVMRLAEKQKQHGKDLLNEPIGQHLPDILRENPTHPVLKLKVRDLLMHRGCLGELNHTSQSLWNGLAKRAALTKAVSIVIQRTSPGSVNQNCYRYRDANYLLLSEIIRNNVDPSGANPNAYEDFVTNEVLNPLGMSDSKFGTPDDGLSRSLFGASGNAGLFTTATDMARYARMMMNKGIHQGQGFLESASIDQMSTPQDPNKIFEHALGFDISPSLIRPEIHISSSSFGHTGSVGSSVLMDEGRKFYLIILANRTKTDHRFYAEYNAFRRKIHALSAQLVEAFRVRESSGMDGCKKVSEARGPKLLPSHGSSSSTYAPASGTSDAR